MRFIRNVRGNFDQIVCFVGFGLLTSSSWDQTKISQRDTDWEDHIGFHLRMSGRQYVCAEGNSKVSETGSGRTGIFVRDAIDIQGWVHIPDGFKL